MDAPRAFSLKLQTVTRDKCGLMPSSIDPELCYKHENGELTCIMSKHVDDLKFVGKPETVLNILQEIQKVFGEMKVNQYDFTNCGVRHTHSSRKP